jgi:outer membrane protein
MRNTRTVFALSACLWLAIGTAEAEFIGLNIGTLTGQAPQNNITNSSNTIELVDDLDIDHPAQTSMMLILEHPITALPNIRYQGYNLASSDNLRVNSGISKFAGDNNGGDLAPSSFNLNHQDIVLYYQLLNNWVDLDMGVDVKRFDGQVSQRGPAGNSINVDETIPLLYLSARIDLPINGLYLGAAFNSNIIDVGLSESTAQDSTIALGYESGTGLGIEGGIKSFSVELNDSEDLNTNFEYDGLFLNGYFNF